ncbi:17138_t:CDS:2, partial [Gigaspora rosea]
NEEGVFVEEEEAVLEKEEAELEEYEEAASEENRITVLEKNEEGTLKFYTDLVNAGFPRVAVLNGGIDVMRVMME